jgi:hypothetical protein
MTTDHKSDRQGQGHERNVVDAVASDIHGGKRADDGNRQSERGNDRCGQPPNEQEDDEHDQDHREHERELHIGYAGLNRYGKVIARGNVDGMRNLATKSREHRLYAVCASTVLAPGSRSTGTEIAGMPLNQFAALSFWTSFTSPSHRISIYFSYILRPPLEGRATFPRMFLPPRGGFNSTVLPAGHTDKGTVERGIERELYFTEPPDFHIFLLYPPASAGGESATFPRMFSSSARRF